MPAPMLKITDSDEDIPRQGRAGLDIPPVLLDAVKDSHETGKTKQLTVSDDMADSIKAFLRSIQNRYGYIMTKGSRDGKKAGTKDIFFVVTEKVDPQVQRAAERAAQKTTRKAAEIAADQQED